MTYELMVGLQDRKSVYKGAIMSDPIKTRQELVDWIEHCVLGDLRTLRQGIAYYYNKEDHKAPDGRALGGGNFLLVAGCCMALDYFGSLFRDTTNNEVRVCAFAAKFLVPINPRYEVIPLLWKCFRLGTVHQSWPKRISVVNDDDNYLIAGVGSVPGGRHLDADPRLPRDSFIINAWQFLTDIEAAFDPGFRQWILEEAPESILQRANPQPCKLSRGDQQLTKVRQWHREP
jgi:hypothetical protein